MAVRPMETTGEVRVSAFATNPTDTEPVMTADEPISRFRGYSGDSITARCGGLSQSVAVQIVADSFPATVGYLEVDYEVHGITRTAIADYDLTFYNGPTPDDDCEDADLPPMGEADCEASTNFG